MNVVSLILKNGAEMNILTQESNITSDLKTPINNHDFRPLVQGDGWSGLTVDIQRRFDLMSETHARTEYTGSMEVKRSLSGWFFAQACCLFGSPLVSHSSDDVPVDVNVYPIENGGLCWQRIFHFKGRAPVTVQSVKIVDQKYGLLECVSRGLGMRLKVYSKDKALHFTSNYYFIAVFGMHLRIPLILTPGAIHVEHIDEGDNKFRFRLSFRHPWLGQTFYQDGVFQER
jgi:hypothetical protein